MDHSCMWSDFTIAFKQTKVFLTCVGVIVFSIFDNLISGLPRNLNISDQY